MRLILVLDLFYSEHFPHSKAAADNNTNKFRRKRIQEGPISAEWDVDDHLVALKARMSPLRTIGVGLLTSAIRVYNVL